MDTTKLINIDGKLLDLSSPVVMAILNVTPDSFFSESRKFTDEDIKKRVISVIDDGASIIDIGGYSSRPGADDVSSNEELSRLRKGVAIIKQINYNIPISVDTFRSEIVAELYNEYGEFIVNDISAGELDIHMLETVGRLGLPYIAMHMKGSPKDMQNNCEYDNVKNDVIGYFSKNIEKYLHHGIKDVIIDPGFGFSKNIEQNFQLLNGLKDFSIFGFPVLAGISRKTMIWKTLGIKPEEALNGTTALHWECLRQGASILRVHDVPEAVQVVKLHNKFKESNNI
ncbi:MAG: dihydropteroate synthase [Rikenellaceae bacterium]|nr:dihydropteroate synthase [Rikenellaceae bacterium]